MRTSATPKQVTVLLNLVQSEAEVKGAFVCDHHGVTLGGVGAYFTPGRKWSECDQISICIVQIAAALQARVGSWRDIVLDFQRRRIFAHDLGSALLVVICESHVNPALMRMTLNVAAAAFKKDTQLAQSMGASLPSRLETLKEKHLGRSAWQLIQKAELADV